MARLRTGTWNELGRDAERLRTTVFVQEQGIAPELISAISPDFYPDGDAAAAAKKALEL